MKISNLKIENFRGIKSAELNFEGHTLLVGRNNVGKSTICEALDLLLGPDRLNKSCPIEEYDFYNSEYLNKDGNNILITIQGVLTELSDKAKSTFGGHLEFWHTVENRVLSIGEIESTDKEVVTECLRLKFIGQYEPDEDEFTAKTFYSHSPNENEDGVLTEVYKSAKREIGFLYLRTIRTGSRALSLEKGTLLDILLRIGKIRPKIWEDTRKKLKELDPPLDDSIGSLRPVLDNIESRINQYISLDPSGKATRLFVSQLTREHLRKTLSFFMSTSKDQSPVPFQDLGTGTLNTLVFALLSAIAEQKKENVIFAMEEPEIAVSPHTQRRIVNYLLEKTPQSFITSHSPYVIERFQPEQIKILRRDAEAKITATTVNLSSGIKPKIFHRKLRHSIAEAILGQAVIVGEGLCEQQVIMATAEIMESHNSDYYPLDLSGITVFDSGGDGNLADYGNFFNSLGLNAFAFYDKKSRTEEQIRQIDNSYVVNKQTDYKGIEKLLSEEVSINIQWKYLQKLSSEEELPVSIVLPASQPSDDEIKKITIEVLSGQKGDSRSSGLILCCNPEDLPVSIKIFLEEIYKLYPRPNPVDVIISEPIEDGIEPSQTPL